jgi:hypothetical protein
MRASSDELAVLPRSRRLMRGVQYFSQRSASCVTAVMPGKSSGPRRVRPVGNQDRAFLRQLVRPCSSGRYVRSIPSSPPIQLAQAGSVSESPGSFRPTGSSVDLSAPLVFANVGLELADGVLRRSMSRDAALPETFPNSRCGSEPLRADDSSGWDAGGGALMDRRARVASIIAVLATLSTGGAAVLATTATLDAVHHPNAAPGQAGMVDDAIRSSVSAGQSASDQSPEAADPQSAGSVRARTVMDGSAGAPATSLSAGGSTASQQGRSEAQPATPEAGPPPPSTLPTSSSTSPPAAVEDPPSSAAPGTVDCHGSDDGMTEAQKQAREAACHQRSGDD